MVRAGETGDDTVSVENKRVDGKEEGMGECACWRRDCTRRLVCGANRRGCLSVRPLTREWHTMARQTSIELNRTSERA
jgi:hypothetical protein